MTESSIGLGRASGKVILFGEHAVVYGVAAIAAGISRGAAARVRFTEHDQISLSGELLAPDHDLLSALFALRKVVGCEPVHAELKLEIPAGAGLGASAAMAVATARAMNDLIEKTNRSSRPLSDRVLFEAGQSWERVFHGTPSGVDVAAAQSSRPIRFEKGSEPTAILLNKPLHLAIAEAGPPASTKEMVTNVASFKARNLVQFDKTLEAISALVDNASLLLASGDHRAIGKLMDLNQILLSGWMLSTEEIESACRLARSSGALGAKLTGSGGGGCVIALAEDDAAAERIVSVWRNAGLKGFSSRIEGDLNVDHLECQK